MTSWTFHGTPRRSRSERRTYFTSRRFIRTSLPQKQITPETPTGARRRLSKPTAFFRNCIFELYMIVFGKTQGRNMQCCGLQRRLDRAERTKRSDREILAFKYVALGRPSSSYPF